MSSEAIIDRMKKWQAKKSYQDGYADEAVSIATEAGEVLPKVREALEAVLPWVVMATAGGDPYRHPQSIENAKQGLAKLQAALALLNGKVGE